MGLTSKLLSAAFRLPPARTPQIQVQRVSFPAEDGEVMVADRYYPVAEENAPVVLVRTPYGLRSMATVVELIAARGYQVLVVALRGTGGSGGRFDGWTAEPSDVSALLSWMRAQPWFPGVFATWGASFLGYSQWTLAVEPIPEWRAAVIQDAPSEVYHSFMYRGGVFALKDWLWWMQSMANTTSGASVAAQLVRAVPQARRLRRVVGQLPVTAADTALVGETVDYYQDWLRHPSPDGFWDASDHRGNVPNLPPVVYVATCWQDIFLPGSLDDAVRIRDSGREVRLLVGPWTHGKGMMSREYLNDVFAVLDHALRGEGSLPPDQVRVRVTGADEWRPLATWPPPSDPQRWFLHAGGALSTRAPVTGASSTFTYDPATPTPTLGGALLGAVGAGVRDVGSVEARSDVLTFTSPVLLADLEVVGPVTAEVSVRSSSPHADVYVRLCDVSRRGTSRHVCDGIVRLDDTTPVDASGARVARIDLWPTAHRFHRGHRVRVHVAGGSHPRFLRNLGTGDQLGTELQPVDQEILHDPDHPSVLVLPVLPG